MPVLLDENTKVLRVDGATAGCAAEVEADTLCPRNALLLASDPDRDNTDAIVCIGIRYGTSVCYPTSSMGAACRLHPITCCTAPSHGRCAGTRC